MMHWVFLIATIIEIVSACPSSCICKWKGGKQSVECVNKSLITVVEGMDLNTQVLDYTGNNLKTLHNEKFQKMGLVNLQKIYLSRCRISIIDPKAFRGLTNLVDLDLSHNLLPAVPSETFPDYPSLMKLTLTGNQIKQIKTGTFQPLSYLVTLELSKCGIEVIEDAAFVGLDSLEWLRLDNNKISTISGSNILPTGLHGIDLHHNPWTCDCLLIGLRRWLESTKTPMAIDPICSVPPRLSSVTIKQLSIGELACEPQITPTIFYLEIAEGKNVSLLCKVSAIPEAKITWRFDGLILQNESISASESHILYSTEEGTEVKKSELFIFNSNIDDNGTFVCVAENQAGTTSSNYTIRVVLKEENVEVVTVFPLEYVLIVSGIISVCSLVLIFLLVSCFLCFRRKKKKLKKKEDSSDKNMTGSNDNVLKNLRESPKYTSVNATSAACMDKMNGGYIIADGHNDMMLYATDSGILVATNNMNTYPSYSISYQIEQNPDLVNDAESVDKDRRAQSGDEAQDSQDKSSETAGVHFADSSSQCQDWGNTCYNRIQPMQHIVLNNVYNQPADIHLTPEKFIDREGYPVDFGLPKIPTHFPALVPATAYYRTLPHRRHTAANPNNRYSREAEFLSRSSQPASYEHYSPGDIRYNIEGYPSASPTPYSSGPRVTFTDPLHVMQGPPTQSSLPIESNKNEQTWTESGTDDQPSTSNPEKSNENKSEAFQAKRHMIDSLLKNRDVKVGTHLHPHRSLMLPPVLTESPDEGYEGECPETTEM